MAKDLENKLVLTAVDNASKVVKDTAKNAEKAFKDTERAAQQSGNAQAQSAQKATNETTTAHRKLEQSYRNIRKVNAAREVLDIRSENAIQREIEQTRAAYDRLKRSGVASQNELRRASEQTKQRIKELNTELGKSSFGDKAASVGRGLIGVGAGVAAGAMVMREPARNQMDFDKRLAMVANTAYSDRDVQGRIAGKKELFKAVEKAVNVGGGTKEDALNSLDTLLASGAMSADTAMNLLPTLQKAAVATGATPDDIAKIAISSMQQMGIGEQDIGKVLDMAVAAGQAGQFELADMAAWLPQQMAAGEPAGLNGLEGFKRLLIANQQARVTAGSSDEAGNNLVNLLGKITAKETNDRFKNLKYKDPKTGKEKGINFAKSMEHYKGKGQDSLQAFMSIMDDVVGGDKQYQELQNKLKAAKGAEQAKLFKELTDLVEGTAIGEIISDRQALMALLGIKNNIQLGQEVDKKVENSQDATEKSHAVVRNTNAHKVEALKNSNEFSQMKNFEQVNNVLGALSEQLAKYANEYPNLTQFLVGAKDAVFTFGAALAASSVLDLLRGGKGGKSSVIGSVIETVATKGKGGLKVGAGGLGFTAVGLGLYAASEGYVPYMARQEAEKEKRAEAEKKFIAQHSSKPSVFTYGNAAMGGIKPQHNYHGAYVVAERLNDNKIAQERGRQGTLSEAEMKSRLERNQAIIDGEIRPSVEATTGALSNYQADFQAFGRSISVAIEAGLTSQSHTLANNITLEVDGRVLAEYVSNELFNFNKRMG